MRYAMVHAQYRYVANVIEWDGTAAWAPPVGYEMVEDPENKAGPGFTYENGEFIPPPSGVTVE